MKNLITSLICIIGFIQPVYAAQKMRDMSMSVEETNELIRQNSIKQQNAATNNNYNNNAGVNAGTGFDDSVPLDPNMARQMREINSRNNGGQNLDYLQNNGSIINNSQLGGIIPPPPNRSNTEQNYINKFCSSSYIAPQATNANQQNCQETQRNQACERFSQSPINVQRILNQAIDCELNAVDFDASGCDGLDAGRLDLLKQYWQDEDVSYNILFLPDLVINVAANCAASR